MGQPSKNGEQSTTVTKLLPGPYVTAPFAKLELGRHTPEESKYTHPMAQSHYYGEFVPYSKAIRLGSVNEYGGGQAPRVALPSKIVEKERIYYVNAKQYHAILRRRLWRAKAGEAKRVQRSQKAYLHESRHLHAMRRARGCGGRFLNTKAQNPKTTN